jgi:hypothetical protein
MRELAAGPLDWDRFVTTSVRHGVAPLAHRGLTVALGESGDGPGASARAQLKSLAARSTARNARLLAALSTVLVALEAHAIRPVALKDLGLAIEVFPEIGLRPLGDLDLLIERAQYDDVARILAALGFDSLSAPGASFTLTHGWGHHFRRAADNVWLDIQWNVLQREWDEPAAGRRSFDPAVLREGAHAVTLPGADGATLLVGSPEATLFHLCAHLEGHEYGELVLFCDIAESLRRQADEFDWDRLLAIAERFEAKATVYHVLELTRRLLGAPVAPATLAALAGDTFRGGVFPAIFGGLGALHYAMDDVEAKVGPPPSLQRRLGDGVCTQAARARALYDEVDAILDSVVAAGAELAVLASSGCGRRFPDWRLDAFGVAEIVVLEEDVVRLHTVCAQRGYARGDGEGDALARTIAAGLEAQVRTAAAAELFTPPAPALTNREIARQSLARRVRRSSRADQRHGDIAHIRLVGMTRTELLVWRLARLGERRHDALFGLPPLLDVLRTLHTPPAGADVIALAARLDLAEPVARGIALIAEVAAEHPLIAELVTLSGAGAASALEWAREGPDVGPAQKALRDAYLVALCLMQARPGERRPLLRAMTRRRDSGRATLAAVARQALRATPGLIRPAHRAPSVYWLEG